jgi:hypothetical protein
MGFSYFQLPMTVYTVLFTPSAFDPHHPVLKAIDALRPDGSAIVSTKPYPYTRLLREDQFPIERAIDVICSNAIEQSWRTTCDRTPLLSFDPKIFANKVIVVGVSGFGGDLHETTIGRVPGVILQANYIEALLGNHLFTPVSALSESVLGIIGLLVAGAVSWFFRNQPFRALGLSFLTVTLFAYGALRVLIWQGYYTEFLIPVISVALLVNSTLILHHFLVHHGGEYG